MEHNVCVSLEEYVFNSSLCGALHVHSLIIIFLSDCIRFERTTEAIAIRGRVWHHTVTHNYTMQSRVLVISRDRSADARTRRVAIRPRRAYVYCNYLRIRVTLSLNAPRYSDSRTVHECLVLLHFLFYSLLVLYKLHH